MSKHSVSQEGWFTLKNQCILSYKQMETIMSIDTKKTFDKMCLYILDGHLEGSFFILINDTYENPTADIIISGKRVNTFSIRSGKRQKYLISPLLVNTVLDMQTREGKKYKILPGWKEGRTIIHRQNKYLCRKFNVV